jgi:hypothetical protein
MEELEITWEASAIETLRLIYSKTKNKFGTKKADKLRLDIVSKPRCFVRCPPNTGLNLPYTISHKSLDSSSNRIINSFIK